jgi:FkbM family methyltransferase
MAAAMQRALDVLEVLGRRLSTGYRALGPRNLRPVVGEVRRRSRVYDVEALGRTVRLRVGRRESDVRTFRRVLTDRGYQFPLAPDPRWIVDAGANIGLATLWFADSYPGATIVAIEPDEENVALLRHNVRGLDNVVVVEGALTSNVGTAQLIDPGEGPWGFRVEPGDEPRADGRFVGTVEALTVESLIERFGIDRIDLLKVDIEGSEREVFEECAGWITRVDTIAIELHDRFRVGCSRVFFRAVEAFADERWADDTCFVRRTELAAPASVRRRG